MTTGTGFGDVLVKRAIKNPTGFLAAHAADVARETGQRRIELLQAIGVAHRELQELDLSASALIAALDGARAADDERLIGLVQVSLSATLMYQGRNDEALATIDEAVEHLSGADQFSALGQRAGILQRVGRSSDALDAFAIAFADPHAREPSFVVAEMHTNRGILRGYLDRFDDAEADFLAAHAMFSSADVEEAEDLDDRRKCAVDMVHNLAWLSGRRGNLARSLELFDEARAGYEALGIPADAILPDRCEVLLAAGLLRESLELAQTSCAAFESRGAAADLAEGLVMVAQLAIRLRDWDRAGAAAERAAKLLRSSGRVGWGALAEALQITAAVASGVPPDDGVARIAALRDELGRGGLLAARQQLDLLHVGLLLDVGDLDAATQTLRRLPFATLPVQSRPGARALRARLCLARGDRTGAGRELLRGLDDLDSSRASLTSSELRVSIGLHSEDLVRLGQQLALDRGRPVEVLRWCERGRARSLRYAPVVEQAGEGRLDAELSVLRDLERQLTVAPPGSAAVDELRSSIRRSAAMVRDLGRHGEHTIRPTRRTSTLAAIRATLGAGRLIQFVDDGSRLYATLVTSRRTALHELASCAEIDRAAMRLRAALTRVITGRGDVRMRDGALQLLDEAARSVDSLLFDRIPPSADPVVLIPTPKLHALPWAAVPGLAHVPFVVAPSIASWMTASEQRARGGRMLAVAGPRLTLAAQEAEAVACGVADAMVIEGADATAGRVSRELRSAGLAHLVCHGRFVADNPLLSSLELADGPLFLYDLERHGALPPVMVLSACSAAMTADRPGEELMGFVATLLAGGCATVIAAAVPLPDTAETLDTMTTLHRHLAEGASPAVALQATRQQHPLIGSTLTAFGRDR
jgi:tetratricopeptide (TPR) repeat protein